MSFNKEEAFWFSGLLKGIQYECLSNQFIIFGQDKQFWHGARSFDVASGLVVQLHLQTLEGDLVFPIGRIRFEAFGKIVGVDALYKTKDTFLVAYYRNGHGRFVL